MRARIYRSAKREFDCKILAENRIVSAISLAILIKGKDHLVVGDYVTLEEQSGQYIITAREERTNSISRYLPREQKRRILGANIDLVVIVMSLGRPKYKQALVDRYLLRSEVWEIPTSVVFNKLDEWDEDEVDIAFEEERIAPMEIPCFAISAKMASVELKGHKNLEKFKKFLQGKTTIFVGQSGVGKSKLITQLSGGEVDLKSSKLGREGKGSHTTTWSEMIDLGNFQMIDSPGVRSFSLEDLYSENLISLFPDLAEKSRFCKFSNCLHRPEDKGCTFQEGITPELRSRLNSYFKIKAEMEKDPVWKKKN